MDKRVHPPSVSDVSASESPHVQLLRLETDEESDEGGRTQLPSSSNDEWVEVRGNRNRRPRQKQSVATATSALTIEPAASHDTSAVFRRR